MPKVIAVVLNWNLPSDTSRCVLSLKRSDYSDLQLVVVDNGSRPDLYAQARNELPGIDFVRSEENLGFAEGNNLGLRYALAHGADYVLVINNDTIVDPGMVSRLVAAAESRPDAGLIGPIIYYLDRPNEVWFAGYRFSHGIYVLRRGLRLAPPIQPIEEVDFVSGCGVLIRRTLLEQVGFFSREYFMYYEDVDLCFRAKAAGIKIVCVTGAQMWHAVSSSTGGSDSPIKQYYQVKSSLIFYRKHFRGPKLWLNVTLRFGHALVTLVSAILHGHLKWAAVRLFLKGTGEGWRQPSPTSLAVASKPIEPAAEQLASDR
jgi:GT2 family glycosyltransferase